MHSTETIDPWGQRPAAGTTLPGRSLSPGYGEGTAYVYRSEAGALPPRRRIAPEEIASECARMTQAFQAARHELEAMRQQVLSEIGEAESHIVGTHLAIVQDREFAEKIHQRIAREQVNAEHALAQEADAVASLLAHVDNECLRERAQDIFDTKNRVLRHLGHGSPAMLQRLRPTTVLVAKELSLSDTLNLDRANVAALALELGGPTSHAAIVARSMSIPAVGAVERLLDVVRDGARILVDAERETVIVDPDPERTRQFRHARHTYEQTAPEAVDSDPEESVTRDNYTVTLLANLGHPSEVDQLRRHDLQGVGLFRTEYLFMQAREAPTLEHQRETYRAMVQQLSEDPLVIRTVDLGGDKRPPFWVESLEDGSGEDWRGLRLCLHEQTLFRTQLRAIIEATAGRPNVGLLLPMVVSAEDLAAAIRVIDQVATEAQQPRPSVGAMFETPSALFESDDILRQVDFASLGTNDLIQYMLAIERQTVEAQRESPIFQPAVLRAMHRLASRARAHDIPLTLCGEAAGDPLAACLILGLGIRRLSMSPVRAPRVRAAIRTQSLADLEALAEQALKATRRADVVSLAHRAQSAASRD